MWRRKNRPIWPGYAYVADAVRYLASACDGALRRDGHGFSSDHVHAGHWLAALPNPEWGPAERHAGEQLVRIYRQQLQRAGFDPDAILTNRRPHRIRPAELQRLTAGWAPDPTGLHQWRWWNGARWTAALAASETVNADVPDRRICSHGFPATADPRPTTQPNASSLPRE